jgi:hypothetical protein
MGVETNLPGSSLGGLVHPQPPPNRKARRLLNAMLRRRLHLRALVPEPSLRVISAVVVVSTFILLVVIVGFSKALVADHRPWIYAALAVGCLTPFLIGKYIVYSVRKEQHEHSEVKDREKNNKKSP